MRAPLFLETIKRKKENGVCSTRCYLPAIRSTKELGSQYITSFFRLQNVESSHFNRFLHRLRTDGRRDSLVFTEYLALKTIQFVSFIHSNSTKYKFKLISLSLFFQ